jgi:hypothetical protein
MKSSSISLLYVPGAGSRTEAVPDEEKAARGHLINLIDSPGHVDFCSEARTSDYSHSRPPTPFEPAETGSAARKLAAKHGCQLVTRSVAALSNTWKSA